MKYSGVLVFIVILSVSALSSSRDTQQLPTTGLGKENYSNEILNFVDQL